MLTLKRNRMSFRGVLLLLTCLGCSSPLTQSLRAMNSQEICDQVRERGQHGLLSPEEAEALALELDRRNMQGKDCLP